MAASPCNLPKHSVTPGGSGTVACHSVRICIYRENALSLHAQLHSRVAVHPSFKCIPGIAASKPRIQHGSRCHFLGAERNGMLMFGGCSIVVSLS